MTTDHRPSIVRVLETFDGSPEWLAACPACQWRDHVAVSRSLIVASANAHEWRYHPEKRPAPEPTPPAHGIQRVRAAGGEQRIDCHCGLGWTGAPSPVRTTMAEHLTAHGVAVPNPWPEAEPPPAPRRLRSSPPPAARQQR